MVIKILERGKESPKERLTCPGSLWINDGKALDLDSCCQNQLLGWYNNNNEDINNDNDKEKTYLLDYQKFIF